MTKLHYRKNGELLSIDSKELETKAKFMPEFMNIFKTVYEDYQKLEKQAEQVKTPDGAQLDLIELFNGIGVGILLKEEKHLLWEMAQILKTKCIIISLPFEAKEKCENCGELVIDDNDWYDNHYSEGHTPVCYEGYTCEKKED